MAKKDPRQAPGEAASIGFIVRRGGRYEVHCAACGSGMATQPGPADKKGAAEALRQIGWDDSIDGLWRCPKHPATPAEDPTHA